MGSAAVADLIERTDHEVTCRRHPSGRGDRPPPATRCAPAGRSSRCRRPDFAGHRPCRHRCRAERDVHAPQRPRHRRRDRRRRPPRGPRLVLPGDAPTARTTRTGRRSGLSDRAGLRRGARPDQHPCPPRRRQAGDGHGHPPVLVHHPPDVDLARHRRDPIRREHRHLGRPRGRGARRASVVHRRRGDHLPGAVRRAARPSRPAPRAGHAAPLDRRSRCRVQGRLSGRRDRPDPGAARTRLRSRGAVRARRCRDLAGAVRGRVHRSTRHRPDRPERERQAGPGRGRPGRTTA